MKKFILVILFITCKIGLAQSFEIINNDTLNYTDAGGLKQKYWIFYGKTKKVPGFKDDQKVEEGFYQDNKKVGIWKTYFSNGNVKNELTYTNNRPSGYAKMYHANGKVAEEGLWENNKWVGGYKYYFENGNLSYEWNYNKEGKREGVQKYYHENGNVMIEGDWKDGKEAGTIKEYYEDGSIRAEKNFKDGALDVASTKVYEPKPKAVPVKEEIKEEEPKKEEVKVETPVIVKEEPKDTRPGYLKDGYNKLLSKNGKPLKEGTFKNGLLIDGKTYEYDGDKLVRTIIYKGGKITETIDSK